MERWGLFDAAHFRRATVWFIMYFGSVHFFKHLILGTISTIFVLLLGLCIFLGLKSSTQQEEIANLKESLLLASQSSQSKSDDTVLKDQTPSFAYQKMYPDMKATAPVEFAPRAENTIYLTFDDGPSALTDELLAILEKYNIKATFFVMNIDSPEDEDRILRIHQAGHTIGIHTDSHVYRTVYASVEDFLTDFKVVYDKVEQITGQSPQIMRYPGGSINMYNQHIYKEIIAEMTRRGFIYYDWNVSGADALKNISAQSVTNNVLSQSSAYSRCIVLLHDGYGVTLQALPVIIEHFSNKGYSFEALTNEVVPITFSYID